MVLEDPGCVDRVLHDWQSVLPATLDKWGVKQQDLQVFFEEFRNILLKNKEECNTTDYNACMSSLQSFS